MNHELEHYPRHNRFTITSCAVASRVASSYEWIRQQVCSIDGQRPDVPASFHCDDDDLRASLALLSSSSIRQPARPTTMKNVVAHQQQQENGASSFSNFVDITIEIHLYVIIE